jgi:hypothetical protein
MGSSGESSESAWAHWLNAEATLDGNGDESGPISRCEVAPLPRD